MSIFTLDWFKSKRKIELEKLKVEKQKLKNDLLKRQLDGPQEKEEKPYLKLKMVNDVLTVVMRNGEILTKIPATVEDFDKVSSAKTPRDLFSLFVVDSSKMQEMDEQEETIKIANSMHVLEKVKGFELRDGSVYLKGINRTIPRLLVDKFIKIVNSFIENDEVKKELYEDVEFVSLKRFFMWCCLNPRAEVADSLYDFLMRNSFRITKQGFFVALRNVVSLEGRHGSNEKVQFISNAYNKVKGVWKKNPEHFDVYERLGELKLIDPKKQNPPKEDWKKLGNLKELYIDLPNMTENRFTDDWTKTFDIRIGKIVSMPMEDCNWSTQDCAAAGLHFTSNEIHYVGCGDTSVLMLINPMKVVGIGSAKGRCYEYLPIMTVPRDEATQILRDLDFDTIDLDEFYVETQLESLSEKAMEAFTEETKKYQFNLSPISSSEIGKIVKNLNKIKDDLRKRVQEVV